MFLLKTSKADGSSQRFLFDHRNRLVRVSSWDRSDNYIGRVDYHYDTFNRMVKREDRSDSQTVIDNYFAGYHGINPTLEFEKVGGGEATRQDLQHRHWWGPQVDQLFADEQISDVSQAGEVLWALPDHLGTIRDIAKFDGTSFEIVNHRRYDSFGNLTDQTDPNYSIAFAYTGKYFDAYSGLSHHWNRWYDPQLGKWITEDPIGFAGGDPNLYRYVGNGVKMGSDSTGLVREDDPIFYILNRWPSTYPTPKVPFNETRPLTAGEEELIESVFGRHLPTYDLRIGIGGFFPWVKRNTMTPRHIPWFPPGNYSEDFSKVEGSEAWKKGHFIHEMVHVLQTKKGNWNYLEAPILLALNGFDYDEVYIYDWDRLGEPLYNFNLEQQADIVADYFMERIPEELRQRAQTTIEGFRISRPKPSTPNPIHRFPAGTGNCLTGGLIPKFPINDMDCWSIFAKEKETDKLFFLEEE